MRSSVAGEEFDGIPVGELPIDEVVWSEERAKHIRTRTERKGPVEINIEPLWASEAALDPNRWCAVAAAESRWRCWATRRRRGGCCWCGSTRPSIRRLESGTAAARL